MGESDSCISLHNVLYSWLGQNPKFRRENKVEGSPNGGFSQSPSIAHKIDKHRCLDKKGDICWYNFLSLARYKIQRSHRFPCDGVSSKVCPEKTGEENDPRADCQHPHPLAIHSRPKPWVTKMNYENQHKSPWNVVVISKSGQEECEKNQSLWRRHQKKKINTLFIYVMAN